MFFKKKSEKKELLSPMDLNYMKTIKFCLYLMGGWPFAELYQTYGEKPKHLPLWHYKALAVFWVGSVLSGGIYLTTHAGKLNFYELGHSYITVFVNIIAVQRIMMPFIKSFRKTTSEFVLKVHLFHHRLRSKYALEVSNQVDKISKFFTVWLCTQISIGVLLFNLTPIYNNIQSGVFKTNDHSLENGTQYEFSIYLYIPLEYSNFGYTLITLLDCLLISICSLSFCTYDLLISVIIFHVWGHLKILKYNLENFTKSEHNENNTSGDIFYTVEESRKVLKLMKYNIEHHSMIMEFMRLASDGFGLMLCFYYIFHQVAGCILLLEVSSLDAAAITNYGVSTIVLFQQLIQVSIVFELVGSKSETIKNAVYGLPWECMDVKNRKVVLIFLHHAQKPITLKAMGMISIGVQTMAAIIKTSISYFLMLRTVAEG